MVIAGPFFLGGGMKTSSGRCRRWEFRWGDVIIDTTGRFGTSL